MSEAINPYRPPSGSFDDADDDSINEFRLHLTSRDLNYGQSHHVIHCRPRLVLAVSLIAIVFCLFVAVSATRHFSGGFALVIMLLSTGVSTLAYLAASAQPKRLTAVRMNECGFDPGETVGIQVDDDELIASVGENVFHWKRDDIKCYKTNRGLMVVPERYVYFLLPARGQYNQPTYKAIKALFLGAKK